jgi:hypothetical protein
MKDVYITAADALSNNLTAILAPGDLSLDPERSLWLAYEAILAQSVPWPVASRAITLSEGDPRLSQWSISEAQSKEWIERIAVGNYMQVLENGPDAPDCELDCDYSDHGDELIGMYTECTRKGTNVQ